MIQTCTLSQLSIKGRILDAVNQPLIGAPITLLDNTTNRKSYTIANNNGEYNLNGIEQGSYTLSVSYLGYLKEERRIEFDNPIEEKLYDFILSVDPILLDEVIIKSERPIIVKNDTTIYKVKYFSNGSEDNVEELLSNIPGIEVTAAGTINIGNREIETVTVDGDDLFNKGYKLLTKNMPSFPIEEVEVIENYLDNGLLKNVQKSEKVALNLKLKNESKNIWFGNTSIAASKNEFYNSKFNLMNFSKRNKYYSFSNLNNIGYDSTGDINDLINTYNNDDPGNIGSNQNSYKLINNLDSGGSTLGSRRDEFNSDKLLSVNSIFNPTDKLKVKVLNIFNYNKINKFNNAKYIYNLSEVEFTNTESYELQRNSSYYLGNIDLKYNISSNSNFSWISKVKLGNSTDTSNLLFNNNVRNDTLANTNTIVDSKLNYTKKISNKSTVILTGRYVYDNSPQTYLSNRSQLKDLFLLNSEDSYSIQNSANRLNYAGINMHYLFKNKRDELLQFKVGSEYREDAINSNYLLSSDGITLILPNYQNSNYYDITDVYFKGKYGFKILNLNIEGNLDLHHLNSSLKNNETRQQQEFYVNPRIRIKSPIGKKGKISYIYTHKVANSSVDNLYNNYILSDYRTITKGLNDFALLGTSSHIIRYEYGKWSDKLFSSATILYSKDDEYISTNSIITENYTFVNNILLEDRKFLSFSLNVDYYIEFIRSNLKLELTYNGSSYVSVLDGTNFRTIVLRKYDSGIHLRSGFSGNINFHLGTIFENTRINTIFSNSFISNTSYLDFNLRLSDKFNFNAKTEFIYLGNLTNNRNNLFIDANFKYVALENKLIFGLQGSNLGNVDKFGGFNFTDFGSIAKEQRLLPRYILLKMELRF